MVTKARGCFVDVSEIRFFEIAVICTLASQFLIVIVGMAFVLCLVTGLGLETWALVRRLSGRRNRMLPPQQTVSGGPWTVPASQLAEAHR